MAKRTEKLRLQTDLQKLQNYRSHMETFKSQLEDKATGLSEELEAAGMSFSLGRVQAVMRTPVVYLNIFNDL